MSDPGRSPQPRRGLRQTLGRILRVLGPGGPRRDARPERPGVTYLAPDTVFPPEPAIVAGVTGTAAQGRVDAGTQPASALQTAPEALSDPEAERSHAAEPEREATAATAAPEAAVLPDTMAASGSTAQVVDPLERTRAALADARRQMPGMLGAELPPGEDGEPAPERRLVSAGVAERLAADWRAIITELQAERRQLSEEVAGLRGLVADLRGDMSRLVGIVGAVQLALPHPAAAGVTREQIGIGEEVAGLSADASSPAEVHAHASNAAALATVSPPATSYERHWFLEMDDDDGQAPPVPTQDFGWRFRPESLPPLETAGDWQPPEAADFEHEEAEPKPDRSPESTAEPHDRVQPEPKPDTVAKPGVKPEAHQHTGPDAAASAGAVSEPEAHGQAASEPAATSALSVGPHAEQEPFEFVAGSSLLVIAGPLQGVRQVTAIESGLAALTGVGPVTLVSFRGREATFRATIAAATPLAAVKRTVEASGGEIGACTVEPDGRTVRIELSRVSVDATGRA